MPQRFQTPNWLVGEFQKSGEFDRLRKQLQTHLMNSDQVHSLMSRVEDIAREKLLSDDNLEHKTREAVFSEVMQDVERYPIVERAISNLDVDKDEALVTSIDELLRNLLWGRSNEYTKLWDAQPSSNREEEEEDDGGDDGDDDDDDESSDYSEGNEPEDDDLLIITDAEGKENGALLTEQPASENEVLTHDDASLVAVDEVQILSGNAQAQSTSLNQRLPVSDSHPTSWFTPTQIDANPPFSPSTSPQVDVRSNLPSSRGGSSSSGSSDNVPVIDVMVCSSGQAMKLEQAETTPEDHAERELSFRGVVLHRVAQENTNGGFRTTEGLFPVLSPRDCDSDSQQQPVASADEAGTFPLVSISDHQEPFST